ncbi:uncharacterized protein LOC132934647 [Metopolophium dirhodum]|uniref:uncharacterized protein LOC132934647 n=1 Tax=Metopolophium dirhodum TaxID=44670 RepID=UPI002990218E|nr:uncharacterized protein LOC132934647 [Metopolophium dirhodum]
MKIDVAKLINEISKHPEIYNPDHKDFSNKEIRNNIFNTVINKDMNGINGEILQRKWDQILNKYANFIRKLSNDDSSERVLERFMKWPWTKPMRIFKPYVRKQFQIPEFQSATQLIPEMGMPHIPISTLQPLHTIPIINSLSGEDAMSGSEFPFPLPTGQGPVQGNGPAEQELAVQYAHTLSAPTTYEGFSNAIETLATPRPAVTQLTHPIPEPSLEIPQASTVEIMEIPVMSNIEFMGPDILRPIPPSQLPRFLQENMNGIRSPSSSARSSTDDDDGYNHLGRSITAAMIQDIRRMITIGRFPGDDEENVDDEEDEDDESAEDDEIATDEEAESTVDDGPSSAKKIRRQEQSGENSDKGDKGCTGADGDTSHTGDDEDDGQSDVLPDLPQPKPVIKRGPSDFSAQEHIFLAWAKTMSTFTAKRQATIKMQINKIMSEAEFEDLDDEFFAANRKPRRPIYTSRY